MSQGEFAGLLVAGFLIFQRLRKVDWTRISQTSWNDIRTSLQQFFWPELPPTFATPDLEGSKLLAKRLFLLAMVVGILWYITRPSDMAWKAAGAVGSLVALGIVLYLGKWWSLLVAQAALIGFMAFLVCKLIGQGNWWALIALFFWPHFIFAIRYWWKYRTAEARQRGVVPET